MNCVRSDANGAVELRIMGPLDARTARDILPIFEAVASDHPALVRIDFAEVSMLDSSGVGAIVSLFKRVKANRGELVIVRAHDQPLAVLKLLKLDRVLGL